MLKNIHMQTLTFEGLGEQAGPDRLHVNASCLHQSLDLVRLGNNHVTKQLEMYNT